MQKSADISIQLVNREYGSSPEPKFERMPRMYLELFENKDKIKPEVVGKEYDPPPALNAPPNERKLPGANMILSDNNVTIENISKPIEFNHQHVNTVESQKEEEDELSKLLSENSPKKIAPKLSTITDTASNYMPALEKFAQQKESFTTEQLDDKKRELLFKFDLLKKSYKNANVPEYSMHSDYRTMKNSYESTLRSLSIDSKVETYKTYLIGGFMLVEFIFGRYLKFDMSGFTQQQIINMQSYERLLIELGEKSYVPDDKSWPVELRLLFLVIVNAGVFVVSKIIMKKTGANLMGMFNSTNSATSAPKKKKKMKGPTINLDDL